MSQSTRLELKAHRYEKNRVLDTAFVFIWLMLGVWSWSWLGPAWVAAMRPDADLVLDFYQDWASAQNYVRGFPVYTPHSVSIPRYLGLPSNPEPRIEYNMHPPTSVLLFIPVARFSYPDAMCAGNAISLLAFFVSLAIVAAVLHLPWSLCCLGLAMLVFCHPVYGNLFQGQMTLILVLLVTAMWALDRSGRSGAAGVLLGTAAAIKLFPAYLVVYYISQGRVRPLIAALISFLTLTLITVLVLGLEAYHDYIKVVLPWNAELRISNYNLSIAGVWHWIFHPATDKNSVSLLSSLALARWGTLISSFMITMIVARAANRARGSTQSELAFAMTAIAMLLVSPVTWDFSLPILLAPFTLIARSLVKARSLWLFAALLLVIVVDCAPEPILKELMLGGRFLNACSWTSMRSAPSPKFYMLVVSFLLGLAAYRFETLNSKFRPLYKNITM
jgi:alpha-1,2-mannosyltransferase